MKTIHYLKKMFSGALLLTLLNLTMTFYGQVEYVDVIPDVRIRSSYPVKIDMNQDGVTDLQFTVSYWLEGELSITEYRIHTSYGVSVAITNEMVSAIDDNSLIDQELNWSYGNATVVMLTRGYDDYGFWLDVREGFVGVRITEDSLYRYGWVRLHQPYSDFYVVDYAIELSYGQGILAGDGIPVGATSLLGEDIDDYQDGRDLKCSFTKAKDESLFSEYRLFIAKADDTTANNVELMSQLPEEKYMQFLVDTLSPSFTEEQIMNENTIDIDGDTITFLVDYRVHILNIARSGVTEENILSTPSQIITLQAYTEPVLNVRGYDKGNSNTSADLHVAFDKVENEQYVGEYRILIAKESDTAGFDLETALSLPQSYYTVKIPDGSDVDKALHPDQLDVGGEQIVNGVEYFAFVLSVADSTYSVTNVLSEPSRKFILGNPDLFITGQITGENVVHYTFDPPPHIANSYYDLDLDNDSTPDFTIRARSGDHWNYIGAFLNVTALRDNQVLLCKHEEHSDWAAVLHTNEQIRPSARWLNGRAIILDYEWDGGYNDHYWGHWSSSDWGGESFYIGLCVMDHETPIYGWVKIACVYNGIEWGIYECAYQTSPNSVQENEDHLNFTLRPNPARGYIYLDNADGLNTNREIHVKIYNKLGVKMDEFTYTASEYRYCISDYPPGLYFCSIGYEGEEEFKVIKFIIY
jgi:hypothetical protein